MGAYMDYIKAIGAFPAKTDQEIGDKKLILKYLEDFPHTILTRENQYVHMTSSSMIFNKTMDKVLMVFHNIYQSWSWTGGHADGEHDLLAVALREAKEETSIVNLTPISNDMVALDILPVWGHMKNGQYISSHEHINATYIFVAEEGDILHIKEDENSDVAWFPIVDLKGAVSEVNMLPVYERIIKKGSSFYEHIPK